MDVRIVKHLVLEEYGPLTKKEVRDSFIVFMGVGFASVVFLLHLQAIQLSLWLLLLYFSLYMILQVTFVIKYRHSVLVLYLYEGTMNIAIAAILLISQLITLIILNRYDLLILFLLTVVLITSLIIKLLANKLSIPFDEQKLHKRRWWIDKGASAGLLAVFGYLLLKNIIPMFPVNTVVNVMFIALFLVALAFIRRGSVYYYRIYLAQKYDIEVSQAAADAIKAELEVAINEHTNNNRNNNSLIVDERSKINNIIITSLIALFILYLVYSQFQDTAYRTNSDIVINDFGEPVYITSDRSNIYHDLVELEYRHPDQTDVDYRIALKYDNEFSYLHAIEFYQEALRINIKHANTSNDLDNGKIQLSLGNAYTKAFLYDEAIECYNKAIIVFEKHDEPLYVSASYNNMGIVYSYIGKYDEALDYLNKAVAIREENLGKDHLDTAVTYHSIASVYYSRGDYTNALAWHARALAIEEKVLGKDHLDIASTHLRMAIIYHNQGDYTQALAWYEKVLAIEEKVLGQDHLETATTYYCIASLYHDQDDYTKALAWYEKVLPIYEEKLGNDHIETISLIKLIAVISRLEVLNWTASW